jgi:hypothetical protein
MTRTFSSVRLRGDPVGMTCSWRDGEEGVARLAVSSEIVLFPSRKE